MKNKNSAAYAPQSFLNICIINPGVLGQLLIIAASTSAGLMEGLIFVSVQKVATPYLFYALFGRSVNDFSLICKT